MQKKNIDIKKIIPNNGQIDGLPKNPRQIRDFRFEKLKKSISDAPEMLSLREFIVFPHEDNFIIIAGNMRYRACQDLKIKELPCKILDGNTPIEKLREYAIKDNENFGEYDFDILANEWDAEELTEWGVELPINATDVNIDDFFDEITPTDKQAKETITIIIPESLSSKKEEIKTTVQNLLLQYKDLIIR